MALHKIVATAIQEINSRGPVTRDNLHVLIDEGFDLIQTRIRSNISVERQAEAKIDTIAYKKTQQEAAVLLENQIAEINTFYENQIQPYTEALNSLHENFDDRTREEQEEYIKTMDKLEAKIQEITDEKEQKITEANQKSYSALKRISRNKGIVATAQQTTDFDYAEISGNMPSLTHRRPDYHVGEVKQLPDVQRLVLDCVDEIQGSIVTLRLSDPESKASRHDHPFQRMISNIISQIHSLSLNLGRCNFEPKSNAATRTENVKQAMDLLLPLQELLHDYCEYAFSPEPSSKATISKNMKKIIDHINNELEPFKQSKAGKKHLKSKATKKGNRSMFRRSKKADSKAVGRSTSNTGTESKRSGSKIESKTSESGSDSESDVNDSASKTGSDAEDTGSAIERKTSDSELDSRQGDKENGRCTIS